MPYTLYFTTRPKPIKLVLGIVIMASLWSCQCQQYLNVDTSQPFFKEKKGYLFTLCKNVKCGLVLPTEQKDFTKAYKLPDGSTKNGYWTGLNIHHQKDSIQTILAGAGTEFWAGKCKFRVVEVEPRVLRDSGLNRIGEYVKFQLLEVPNHCTTCNQALQQSDTTAK